jgi:dimethylargininase
MADPPSSKSPRVRVKFPARMTTSEKISCSAAFINRFFPAHIRFRLSTFAFLLFTFFVIAIVREVSPSINDCELSFHARQRIDVAKAIAQHQAYQDCLEKLGARIVSLPAEPDLPDAVFVEDAAIVVDEVAVITNIGAPSRRPEARSVAETLSRYRPVKFISDRATLDGGDVLRIGRKIFVGLSQRTNRAGFSQLREILGAYDYEVEPIEVSGCLHLKSACSQIGDNTIFVNRSWIDVEPLHGLDLLDVPEEEPPAANALLINDVVIIPSSFPKTRMLLEEGFRVRTIDLSELQKAEAGVTCGSLIFNYEEI